MKNVLEHLTRRYIANSKKYEKYVHLQNVCILIDLRTSTQWLNIIPAFFLLQHFKATRSMLISFISAFNKFIRTFSVLLQGKRSVYL